MQRVTDIDAVFLLAVARASKRRPAELAEIVAAAELVAGDMPDPGKLAEAAARLSTHGLLVAAESGLALSAEAQQALVGEPAKAEPAARIFWVRDQLSGLQVTAGHAAIELTARQIDDAIKVHRTAAAASSKNLLAPRPKPPEEKGPARGPGFRQRKPMPARRRRP